MSRPYGALRKAHATFTTPTLDADVVERPFLHGDVPGLLWSPVAATPAAPRPLVLTGHPGGMHSGSPRVAARARQLALDHGFHVAAIDAPGEGARVRGADDEAWLQRLRAARRAGEPLDRIVAGYNESLAERAVPEWRSVLDDLLALPEIDRTRPVGYSGLTLGTEIGLRLVAEEPRIGAAILGSSFGEPSLCAAAARVTVPVLFLLPWDDAEIGRESQLRLFTALASTDKTMHATSGSHRQIPAEESAAGGLFLARHLLN